MRKIFVIITLAVFSQFLLPSGFGAEKKPDLTAVLNKIEKNKLRIMETEKKHNEMVEKIFKKSSAIRDMIEKFERSENNLAGLSGLGRIEQMQIRADRFVIERRSRKNLADENMELFKLIDEWRKSRISLKEEAEMLRLNQKIYHLSNQLKEEEQATVSKQFSEDEIEYYQVKKAATLGEISALPFVYGDSTKWRELYNANKDKVKVESVDAIVPAGTTLIMPDISEKENEELAE